MKTTFQKRYLAIALSLLMAASGLTACASTASDADQAGTSDSTTTVAVTEFVAADAASATYPSYFDVTDQFTDRDLSGEWDNSATAKVTLSGSDISIDGTGVTADGTTITITKEGTYVFSGTLDDGQIIVAAAEEAKVQIVLNGVTMTNDDSACILVLSADKVFVTAADGTVNTLSDTGKAYTQTASDYTVDGVIFSRDDLVLNGTGTLTINAGYQHGVVGKDDVKLAGLTLNITAAGKGVAANDSLRVASGTYNITSQDDALHTSNGEDGEGYVYIAGGAFTLASGDDGIHAETGLIIDGGTITVTKSYEALEGHTIDINGGTIDVVASDDGLNAAGGSSDEAAGSNNGPVADWYNDGQYYGNGDAAAGTSSETTTDVAVQTAAGGPGGFGGGMESDANAYLVINGGTVTIDAGGDGLDSNGTITVNSGIVYVNGPTNNGNGAIDCALGATVNGGTVVAAGSAGMAETFGSSSEQYSILCTFGSQIAAGTEVTLSDANGNVILTYTPSKAYQSVVFSSADITAGTYTVTAGNESTTVDVSGVSTAVGQGGMMGGFGGSPQGGGMTDGSMPQMPGGGQGPGRH